MPVRQSAAQPQSRLERKWIIYVDDNFNYMDEGERYALGEFDTFGAAVAACKAIIDEFLTHSNETDAAKLFDSYRSFGEDPFIIAPIGDSPFSAWEYAEQRCKELRSDTSGLSDRPQS